MNVSSDVSNTHQLVHEPPLMYCSTSRVRDHRYTPNVSPPRVTASREPRLVFTAECWWRWSVGGRAVKHRNTLPGCICHGWCQSTQRAAGEREIRGEKPFYSTTASCLYTTQRPFNWNVTLDFWQRYWGPETTAQRIYYNLRRHRRQQPLSWEKEQ